MTKVSNMDLQKLSDAISEQSENTRSRYHLTLGELISFLRDVEDRNKTVELDVGGSPDNPHSYRGYYSDLGIDAGEPKDVWEVLSMLENVLDKELTGYKGGQFTMGAATPLWKAEWGTSRGSRPIMNVGQEDERVVLVCGGE